MKQHKLTKCNNCGEFFYKKTNICPRCGKKHNGLYYYSFVYFITVSLALTIVSITYISSIYPENAVIPSAFKLSKKHNNNITYTPSDSYNSIPHKIDPILSNKSNNVCLDVKNILQLPNLPNGCEAVSLAIVLNYLNYDIDPLVLYNNYMPKAELYNGNPMYNYIGNATNIGFGCYAPCIVHTGNNYLKSQGEKHKVFNVSGYEIEYYKKYIDEGIPVILWGLIDMNGNDKRVWDGFFNGEPVVWHSYSHCLVLIGYNETGYIFCDPLVGIKEYSKSAVEKSFAINFRQACIVK